ncbi:DUF6445 family protein [Lysobacter enzymogenes]|uniref:Uncharacterized protein n=2 Tax=Lysobacter enzymogenes TaxID=69 RepID=A0A0S2DHC7_LYSEN|nr:DUF6445 family protein [Lysobacter enzymogenes]ALN57860.1 hypothetical protein GLE_2511 [Lysobacter enzymogenes]QCW26381.1 hypothetical protein FE772_12620 [Lysobacter enzymogenes]UZW58477.1 DUF6445 family protein [Lysobacter enzymogenes]
MSVMFSQPPRAGAEDVALSKDASIAWHELEGPGGLPMLVIDNALEDPHRVRECAWASRFHTPGPNEYYPGWQATAQMSGEKRLIQDLGKLFLDRLWSRGWPPPLTVADLVPHSTFSVFGMDHEVARRNGYIDQHVDTFSWIAVVTYLFEHDERAGYDRGTAFWKHRPTDLKTFFLGDLLQAAQIEQLFGLNFIDPFRKASVRLRAASMAEAQKQILENPASTRRLFSLEEDNHWSLLKFVPARFNRMVAYPTWQFHSIVDTSPIQALSTRNARLTYNTFIPYPVPAGLGPQPKYQGGGYAAIDGMRVG